MYIQIHRYRSSNCFTSSCGFRFYNFSTTVPQNYRPQNVPYANIFRPLWFQIW